MKYIFFVIFGILLYLFLNTSNDGFSVGIPEYEVVYIDEDMTPPPSPTFNPELFKGIESDHPPYRHQGSTWLNIVLPLS